ncbi:hypothetical protein BHM03_00030457 [Ensete ventricosum]|nr:hypothetical protein BHM03_00030457 [Ensete ventricosum]
MRYFILLLLLASSAILVDCRYDDAYDRIWQLGYRSCVATYYCRDDRRNSSVLTVSASVEVGSNDAYKVPSAIMQSAAVSSDSTLILSLSNGDDVVRAPRSRVYLHFAELRVLKGNQSSKFQVRVPGNRPSLINISLEYLVARHIPLNYQANSDPSTFYLNLTGVPGSLPPLLNAMEAYYYVNLTTISTDQGDAKRQPKWKWRDTRDSSFHTGSPHFTYQDLRTITNNFERVIGKGGFGTVYYGRLHDGTEVAVKMQKRFLAIEEGITEDFVAEELGSDSHGIKEFQVEVGH